MNSSTPIDDAYGLPLAAGHRAGLEHLDADADAELLAQHALDRGREPAPSASAPAGSHCTVSSSMAPGRSTTSW